MLSFHLSLGLPSGLFPARNGISYQFSNYVEFKLVKFLQLIGTIKRTVFKKVRTEIILNIYNTLVLPTFYMGQKI